jgi:hypothetical protein
MHDRNMFCGQKKRKHGAASGMRRSGGEWGERSDEEQDLDERCVETEPGLGESGAAKRKSAFTAMSRRRLATGRAASRRGTLFLPASAWQRRHQYEDDGKLLGW